MPSALLALLAISWAGGCGPGDAAIPNTSVVRPASIQIEPERHDLGLIATRRVGEFLEVPTTLRNVGGKTLEIPEIRTTCSCTVSELRISKVPPGGQVVFKTRIKLGDSPEPRQSGLTIFSSDPERPTVGIHFEWQVVNPLRLAKGDCRFPRLAPGDGASRVIELESERLTLCDRCELAALIDSSLISAHCTPRDGPRSPRHDPARVDSGPLALGTVKVNVLGSDESRDYRHTLSVIVRCGPEVRAKLDLPVTWSVGAGLRALPARLSFGSPKGGEHIVRRVVITSDDRKPFKILGIASEPPNLLRDVRFDAGDDGVHSIVFGMVMPEVDGPWTSKLLIKTDDPETPSIALPMSAMIANVARK